MPVSSSARRRRRLNQKGLVIMNPNPAVQGADGQGGSFSWWQQLLGVELVVGAFVVLWYIWSYLFYLGTYTTYHLPIYLLEISLVKLLKPGVRPFFSFVSYYFCIYFFFKKKTMISFVMMVYFMLLCIFFLVPGFNVSFKEIILIILFPIFVFLFMAWRKTADLKGISFRERIKRFEAEAERINQERKNAALLPALTGIIIVLAVPLFPIVLGIHEADGKTDYYVIERKDPAIEDGQEQKKAVLHVVLDTYQNYYITAPLSPDNKTFKPEFELIPIHKEDKDPPVIVATDGKQWKQEEKNNEKVILKYMKIGPLKPEE